ncbi:MAG TPA: DNA primase [Acidimicrobiales bacterium]|nr:DNA primase [Acidimicrobiales bacterium]
MDEDVARVKAATDFVQIASEHMALRKVGRRWQGLCPFHAEKSPSFSVNAEEGLYHCFGCQASGDVIKFVREIDHVDFVEAVERLAAKAGIQLRYDDATEGRDRKRKTLLIETMQQAVDWYHQRLLSGPDGAKARAYLRSRGYDGDVVRRFKIGWAPDEWDALVKALHAPVDVLKDTGLGFVNRRGRQQDAFRARVMFPIFDVSGKAVAFGGRVLPGGEGPKYKNSPETALYSKSGTLYALNWAKEDVVKEGEVVVCEGYTDVIGFFEAGVPRAVATCGTALTEEHFRSMKKFANRVVLAYDADAAGQAAAERFYEWERKYEIDVAVAALPPGQDPGDVAFSDPGALQTAVKGAKAFLAFRLERVLGKADLRSPEGRARTAEAALAVIAEHPNDLVRDQYLMEVADRCRIEPDRLRQMVGRDGKVAPVRRPEQRGARPEQAGPEVEALKLALHRPEAVAHLLDEVLFEDELHRAAFMALAASATLHDAIESADAGAAELLHRLAVEDTDAEPEDVVARLADRAVTRVLHLLEAEARSAPDRFTELSPTVSWLRLTVEQLREPPTRVGAFEALVAWLKQNNQGVE